jgi:epoxyqueuosine reductase QueG
MEAARCISYLNIELKGSIPDHFRPKIGSNVFGCDICQDVCPWNNSRQSSVLSYQQAASQQRQLTVSYPPSAISNQQTASPQLHSSDKSCVREAATTKVPQFHPMAVELTHAALSDGGAPEQLTTDDRPSTTITPRLTTDHGPLTTDTASFSLFNPRLDALALISEEDFRRIFAHSPIKRAKYRGWLRNLCVAMGNSGDERFVPWLERAAQHSDSIVREHAAWALERLRGE